MSDGTALGVYVHWPYCARICPYCDFNVYKTRKIDADRWIAALTNDLKHWAAKTTGRKLTSLYFGGGTPSLAPLPVVEAVIETCETQWGFEPSPEITLEANPSDAEQSRFTDFATAGINRLSLGVQSLRDDALQFLGRDHSAADARRAAQTAMAKFDRVNFDFIYGRPGQTLDDWHHELNEAFELQPTHLSLYQLTIEPGTAFDKAVTRGDWAPLEGDSGADFYNLTQKLTHAAELPAYEISNHATAGEESQHNLLYWRQQDYIGVGPGAHGRLTLGGARMATETYRAPEAYLKAVEETGSGASTVETLDADGVLAERLAMGLRLTSGVALYADDHFYANEHRIERLQMLIDEGLVTHDCGTLRATQKGRPVLNSIISHLLT